MPLDVSAAAAVATPDTRLNGLALTTGCDKATPAQIMARFANDRRVIKSK